MASIGPVMAIKQSFDGPLDQHLQGEGIASLIHTNVLSPLDPLDWQCSTDHMLTVAAKCIFNWRVVGRRLLMDRPQTIEDIDREERSEDVKRDKMFEKWKEMKGSSATYRALMEVFEEIGNHQAAEMVKGLVLLIAEGTCI